jgi:lysophospholipase L1-like esterase
VYAWIPIPGAVAYEVELCSQPPENPNDITPSVYRIWSKKGPGYDLYDDLPRIESGTYYWRVRGLDEADNPVGVYSDAGKFTVDLDRGSYAACLGDSITHGGGAVSYSPSDLEYSFETYLSFPVVNLGRSGDTTETMVARFASDVLPFKPRYLLILGGSNSIRGGVTGQQVVLELMEIRRQCEENGIRPIFLTLPPINPEAILRVFGEETAPYWRQEMTVVNQYIRQQEYYIDIEPFLCNEFGFLPEQYAVDGLHPDIEVKKIIGMIINENWARVTS